VTGGLEYSLVLETGEGLDVLELDSETCPELRSEAVRVAASHVLRRCTFAPQDVLEEAKRGFCKRLQDLLRTPPVGCLLSVADPECALLDECGIADSALCTTRFVSRRGGRFPVCWEARPSRACPEDVRALARDLAGRVVHAWRDGRYVVIVSPG
jgi:hypothetical protein